MTFVEGSQVNNWRRSVKIQNDLTTSNLAWELRITRAEDWWKISNSSQHSGELAPGEYNIIYVEVDRTGKTHGDYHGFFFVDSEGDSYVYSERVNLTMEVGNPPPQDGPKLRNITTNFGDATNRLMLSFNKFINPGSASSLRNYKISPTVDVRGISVNKEHVILATAEHTLDSSYSITIKSIADLDGVESVDITGKYQFFKNLSGADLLLAGTGEEYIWDNAINDKLIYTDKMQKLGNVPETFHGCALLRTAWDDLNNHALGIKFTILAETATVYLAVDPDKNGEWDCDWLNEQFHSIPDSMPVRDSRDTDYFKLYESDRVYAPGDTVHLLQNGAPDRNSLMYFVLVRGSGGQAGISGRVSYHSSGLPVPNTQLMLSGGQIQSTMTNSTGDFYFSNLSENLDFELTPAGAGEVDRRTIRMYDAALAARIAGNLLPRATAAQMLAADVDADGQVTLEDAFKIARYVVGLLPDTHTIGMWQFLPPSQAYFTLTTCLVHQDFTALISGDVNADWVPSGEPQTFVVKNSGQNEMQPVVRVQADRVVVPIVLRAEPEIAAFDFKFHYNYTYLEFDAIETTALAAPFETFVNASVPGQLELGGFCAVPVKSSGEYLRVVFRIKRADLAGQQIELRHISVNGIYRQPVLLNLTDLPVSFRLYPNFPNPFNPETIIEYQLAHQTPQLTLLKIFNAKGQLVTTLVNKELPAGTYSAVWNGTDASGAEVASGVYLLSIQSGDFQRLGKMLKLR